MQLTSDHVDMASRMARKLWQKYRLPFPFEDARSVAYVALAEASQTYDQAIGNKFSNYAFYRIRGSLLDYSYALRGAYRKKDTRVLPPKLIELDSDTVTVREPVDDSTPLDECVSRHERLSSLTERKRSVLKAYLIDGALAREIGAQLGVTEARVSQLISEIADELAALS